MEKRAGYGMSTSAQHRLALWWLLLIPQLVQSQWNIKEGNGRRACVHEATDRWRVQPPEAKAARSAPSSIAT
jgi:hypothetical protein